MGERSERLGAEMTDHLMKAMGLAEAKLERGEFGPPFLETARKLVEGVRKELHRREGIIADARGRARALDRDMLGIQADAMVKDVMEPWTGHMATAARALGELRGTEAAIRSVEADVDAMRSALGTLEVALAKRAG